MKTAYAAGHLGATSSDTFVIASLGPSVTFTFGTWSTGSAVAQSGSPFDAGVGDGDFRYDVRSARLLYGSSGSASQEMQAFRIVAAQFVKQEGTGASDAARGYGPNVALATDGSVFYYGRLAVDALDVTHTLHVFPDAIYAASGDVAFGKSAYYDAHTTTQLGTLGFDATVYALNASGTDFWAFDATANVLRHFVPAGDAGNGDGGAFSCVRPTDGGVDAADAAIVHDAAPPADAGPPDGAAIGLDAESSGDADADDAASSLDDASVPTSAPLGIDAARGADAPSVLIDTLVPSDDTATAGCGCSLPGAEVDERWSAALGAVVALAAAARARRRVKRAGTRR